MISSDYLFKLVIVGNAGVGKSSLLLRFSDNQFNENYLTTLGVDFRFKTINVESKNAKLQIVNSQFQQNLPLNSGIQQAKKDLEQLQMLIIKEHMLLISFKVQQLSMIQLMKFIQINNFFKIFFKKSFIDIEKYWLSEIEQYGEKNVQLMLIGNKCDLEDEKKVDTEIAQKFASERDILFFEASAKTAIGVNTAFQEFSKLLMNIKFNFSLPRAPTELDRAQLTPNPDLLQNQTSCC